MTTSPSTPRRGRPPIPKERIVSAALEILARDGAEALSLRSLAAHLSSSTSTLYRHVANRGELLELVVDELLGEVLCDLVVDTGSVPSAWDDECRAVATRLFRILTAHRGAAGLVGGSVPTGPNALAVREHLLRVLTAAGFPLDVSAQAVATLGHYVIGFAIQAPAGSPDEAEGSPLSDVDSIAHPLTSAALPRLPFSLEVEFAFGLDLIMDGLRGRREP